MSLNKTMAILAGITAIGAAEADQYTDALNLDNPTIGNLAANYNEQAPSVKGNAIKGAQELITQNASDVKSGKISAQEYAKQTAKKLLTPNDPTIGLLPPQLAQACLTVYGADLMQEAAKGIKEITKLESSARHLAEQTTRTENPDMIHNFTSDLGVGLIKHDVATNLTQGQIQTAEVCFDMVRLLNDKNPNQKGIELTQEKGAAGLETLKNYENPYDFTAEQAKEIIDSTPSLKEKGTDKMNKSDRDNAIKDYMLRENGTERAALYLDAYRKDSEMKVTAPTPQQGKSRLDILMTPSKNLGPEH